MSEMITLAIQFLLIVTIVFVAIALSLRAVNETERELLEEMDAKLRIKQVVK